MSKTYFGRCAAVGIAGLTAMSSIAIVASAANQTSMLYELKYNGIASISMRGDTKYGNGNEYCNPVTPADDLMMDGGFTTSLTNLFAVTGSYDVIENGVVKETKYLTTDGSATTGTPNVWTAADFTNAGVKSFSATKWDYVAYGEIASAGSSDVALKDPYTGRGMFTFLTEADRTNAKNTMIAKIKSEYTALASKANAQFSYDINTVRDAIIKNADNEKQQTIKGAESTYASSSKDAAAAQLRSDTIATANNKYNAIYSAVVNSASKIVSEFGQAFNVNNFVYDYKTGDPKTKDTFGEAKCPVTYTGTTGGLSGVGNASYTTVLGTAATPATGVVDLTTAMYNTASTVYNSSTDFAFKGELSDYATITSSQLIGNGNWKNYQIIDNNANSGGNTTPGGNTNNDTKKDNTTTTVTTWYPDSAAYRAASEVSYLGKNGSWYTSASAATTYGGGYTGTSKNSNYSAVNSANNGKAIYFDSTSGTYTTTATSYSYVVKEATTTNDDPYYNYFFGNKNNNTTTSVPAGSPAISGASKYAGWTNISAYITNRAKSGATYTINMNDGTVVPAAVLAAAKAKNVTLVFANDNGSKVTAKPGKVSTTSDLNVAVTYNVKDVKTSLVNKAKKINKGTVSTAQVRIGTDGSIGGTETVTVKFSTKRAGCTVKAYRLTESGSLKKEASGTVASTGRVNLNLTKGGSYLLVVID